MGCTIEIVTSCDCCERKDYTGGDVLEQFSCECESYVVELPDNWIKTGNRIMCPDCKGEIT